MNEPAGLATTAVSLPQASERLDIENSETAPNRPQQEPTGSRRDCRVHANATLSAATDLGGSPRRSVGVRCAHPQSGLGSSLPQPTGTRRESALRGSKTMATARASRFRSVNTALMRRALVVARL